MADPKSRFSALKSFRDHGAETEPEQTPVPSPVVTPPVKARGRPAGKRSNPEFEPTTVLLKKKTKRSASRLLEDTNTDQDLSELIESLLNGWISTHS